MLAHQRKPAKRTSTIAPFAAGDDYLRTVHVAAYTKIPESTWEKLRVYGGGPPYCKLGRVVVYRRQDIDAWIISRSIQSTSTSETAR